MQHIKAFIAGFVATLVFHQGVYSVFYLAGLVGQAPFSMAPTEPFGVPQVISLAFWGGVWGIVIWWLIRGLRPAGYWISAVLLGAIGPSAVALLVVFPLKGMPLAGGWDPALIIGALIINGAWGLGVAALMRVWRAMPR